MIRVLNEPAVNQLLESCRLESDVEKGAVIPSATFIKAPLNSTIQDELGWSSFRLRDYLFSIEEEGVDQVSLSEQPGNQNNRYNGNIQRSPVKSAHPRQDKFLGSEMNSWINSFLIKNTLKPRRMVPNHRVIHEANQIQRRYVNRPLHPPR